MTILLVGFDSAWTPTNSGALTESSTLMTGRSTVLVRRRSWTTAKLKV